MDAATFGDVVMLTVPLEGRAELARDLAPILAGKIVLDTGKRVRAAYGALAREASAHPRGLAGPGGSHVPGRPMGEGVQYPGTTRRSKPKRIEPAIALGIPLACDDPGALDTAVTLAREAGFDPVVVGPLVRGRIRAGQPRTTPA